MIRFAALLLALLAPPALFASYAPPGAGGAYDRARAQRPDDLRTPETDRPRYRIDARIDFDRRTYSGTERVRWTNTHERQTNVIYFNLYPNLRAESDDDGRDGGDGRAAAPGGDDEDEPRLEIDAVRLRANDREAGALPFAFEERGGVLRVALRQPVARGSAVEVEISFRGRVPEIDAEETGLLAHVVRGVDAALRDRPEVPRAREFAFRSRGVMLLAAWYPVLAVRDRTGDWQRKPALHLGRVIFAEAADYDVEVTLPASDPPASARGAAAPSASPERPELFAAGDLKRAANLPGEARRLSFTGGGLRDFAVVLGRGLRSAETTVAGVRVRSVFGAEQEHTGRRALEAARAGVELFARRFGPLPYDAVTIVAAPLAAGRGALELAGLLAIASAFYVDFDQPAARSLPEMVREQRASVEDSLEWTIAQGVAHQWWGAGAVGSDPRRAPALDEGLAQWSALLYFRSRYDERRAAQALEDQLRGVYSVYRTFGGEDREADRQATDYRNSFQFAAIVGGKGALLIEALRGSLGDEQLDAALRDYYSAFKTGIAQPEDFRSAFARRAINADERRQVARLFDRWLSERRGDEDIAAPNADLADALGLPAPTSEGRQPGDAAAKAQPSGGRVADKIQAPGVAAATGARRVARFGRFFWKQMTRIR